MEAWVHIVVTLCGMAGILLGGVLIDLDHSGSLGCMWKRTWHPKYNCDLGTSGIFHKPVVVFSIVMFMIGFSFAILTHYLMDFIHVTG